MAQREERKGRAWARAKRCEIPPLFPPSLPTSAVLLIFSSMVNFVFQFCHCFYNPAHPSNHRNGIPQTQIFVSFRSLGIKLNPRVEGTQMTAGRDVRKPKYQQESWSVISPIFAAFGSLNALKSLLTDATFYIRNSSTCYLNTKMSF